MTKRDIAGFLGVDTKTLYNWEKNKPNLYKTVMKGLAYDEIVEWKYHSIRTPYHKHSNACKFEIFSNNILA